MKDELGHVDPERGSIGGRDLVAQLPGARGFDVSSRLYGATRAVGFPQSGFADIDAVRALAEKLDDALAKAKTKVTGPLMRVLVDNPFEVMAPDRNYFVARTITGPSPTVEGLQKVRLDGGSTLVLPRKGRIEDLENEYGFIFGKWMPAKNYELARPHIREVYLEGLEVDDADRVPMEILVPIALRLSKDEPA